MRYKCGNYARDNEGHVPAAGEGSVGLKRYSISSNGCYAICPRCKGLMKRFPNKAKIMLQCVDCKKVYVCVGEGTTERDLEYAPLMPEEGQNEK